MCGRFNLRPSAEQFQKAFNVFRVPAFPKRYNIAPTQDVLFVVQKDGQRECEIGRWGFRPKWSKAVLINARAESVFETSAFKSAVRERRCLVPASGFYEWEEISKRTKRPFHIWLKSGELMAFAGMLDSDGSVAMMTTDANAEMSRIHDRMPVILSREVWSTYLDPSIDSPDVIGPLLKPMPDGSMTMQAVNPIVSNARNETPECIEPETGANSGLLQFGE